MGQIVKFISLKLIFYSQVLSKRNRWKVGNMNLDIVFFEMATIKCCYIVRFKFVAYFITAAICILIFAKFIVISGPYVLEM